MSGYAAVHRQSATTLGSGTEMAQGTNPMSRLLRVQKPAADGTG
jgi:hypothetical protein